MQKERFTNLQEGLIYKNINGNSYLCVSAKNGEFVLRNVETGWTFTACGIWQYPDGSIEWDYSVGGYFADDAIQQFNEQVEEAIKSLESLNQAMEGIQRLEEERKAEFRKMVARDSKRKNQRKESLIDMALEMEAEV